MNEVDSPPVGEPAPGGGRRIPWARIVISILVLAGAAAVAIGLANRDQPLAIAPVTPAADRPPAPDVSLPLLQAGGGLGPEGRVVTLSELRGRVVVLNFWAWWCFPCRNEVPILQRASERYEAEEVLFLGINVEDLEEDARRFLVDHPFEYPSLRDPGTDTSRAFNVHGYPSTIVLDPRGRFAARYSGEVTDVRQVTDPIDDVLAGD